MPLTRQAQKDAYKHIITNVLGRDATSPLRLSLDRAGVEDIGDLMSLTDTDIDNLNFDRSATEVNVPLDRGSKTSIRIIQLYNIHRNNIGEPIQDDWVNITQNDYDQYRMSPEYTSTIVPRSPTTTTGTTTSTSISKRTPAENFRRGIKRDPSVFPTLKDERYNDIWHRSFMAQARAQDVVEVLDHTYVPATADDTDLFSEKQKYVFAILEAKILTDMGKSIVREHESDFDAQKVYKKLQDHHTKSTKAMIDSSTILSYITSARLGNGDWKGTTEAFIIHWQNQVRLYEKQVPTTDHFSSGQKRTMLQNAVHPITELRAVKNNADLEKTRTGTELSYDQYTSLLLSAASAYDTQFQVNKRSSKRLVYTHDVTDYDQDFDDGEDLYDIDMSVATLQAHMHDRSSNRSGHGSSAQPVRMPRERWMKLTQQQKQKWDELDDSAKAVILGTTTKGSSPFNRSSSNQTRRVNLHEVSAYDFLQANMHDITEEDHGQDEYHDAVEATDDTEPEENSQLLVQAAKQSGKNVKFSPGDIRKVMSTASKRDSSNLNGRKIPSTNGNSKISANQTLVTYKVSAHASTPTQSLVDRGANGGVGGADVRLVSRSHRKVDVQGIDNHQVNDLAIATVGGVVSTHKGDVIAILHNYAYLGTGSTIHSPGQLESYKNIVDDKSVHVGGRQRIKTVDGYLIPLSIKNGLPRMAIRPYTNREWDELPHVILTDELDWDPTVLDHDPEEADDQWHDAVEALEVDPHINLFDEYGNYRHRVIAQSAEYLNKYDEGIDAIIDNCVYHAQAHDTQSDDKEEDDDDNDELPALLPRNNNDDDASHTEADDDDDDNYDQPLPTAPRITKKKEPDFNLLRPFFGWLSTDIIKRTFEKTTQYARIPMGTTLLKKHYKSPNPALNVQRRNESVATDTVYSDTPAVDDGSTVAQIFVGTETLVTDIYGIKTDKQFVNTLEDNIRDRGAPNKLISDRAQVEISKKVQDILRSLFIGSWQSEPHQQHQNPAERRYQTVKNTANRIMDRTGAPAYTWLLCLLYVCFLLNYTFCASVGGIPMSNLTGSTVDISVLLRFWFWQKVYYMKDDSDFPSSSKEGIGHIVGISENVGHALTWKILTNDTLKVIHRSNVRPCDEDDINFRAAMIGGESDPTETSEILNPIIKSRHDPVDGESNHSSTQEMPVFNPADLVGRTFLMDQQEDGQRHRARIVKLIQDHEDDVATHPDRIKFMISVNDDKAEEVISYNQMLDHITRDEENTVIWKFRRITSHQGPLRPEHPDYKGSSYNVMVEWENGEITSEPLKIIAADDPVTCAIYAKENNLLETEGWKRFKGIAKRQKKFTRMVNQAKLRSYSTAPRYQYGYEVPRDYNHALRLDERNKNTRWQEATQLEMTQIDEYETFTDLGHKSVAKVPDGYKKIRVHLVYAVKHDGRHKARLVADGHLTEVPTESVYSGVVSLRGFRLVLFLAELNGLELWATDIGSAYLEAKTNEKVYIIAGPEFGEREGHVLLIHKAIYGLRSSGARWHARFSDCLRSMGFEPSKSEPDIWMRRNGDIYEYIAVYVDDLALALKDPQSVIDLLKDKHNFKLKGTGPISFHLGMDFVRDEDTGTLCITPRKYIEKMIASFERMFGHPPKQTVSSPLDKNDHPELDTSELLDDTGIKKYQSLIGALQWVITIGRFDVMTAVMTLSSFRAAPRRGHLERVKRIYGYLAKMKHSAIRIRTDEPDYSELPDQEFDWSKTVYGEPEEIVPKDAPEPLGKYVTLTHYVDANLMHDMVTGRSVTGILHLLNKTPMDWYSKKQATVETATYGSEFVAARTCVEQIIDLRTTLRYLGVPIRDKSYMFGDNKSVVDSSITVHARLHKRHTILSFHRVREAMASGMLNFHHIPGEVNPSDILSKHWSYSSIWPQLRALLFWKGDTANVSK